MPDVNDVIRDEASLVEAGTRILEVTGAKHVVITRGKDGMAIFSAGEKAVRLIPTYAREVYDVSGAGDTVIAALTLAPRSAARRMPAFAAFTEIGDPSVGMRMCLNIGPTRRGVAFIGTP